MGQIDKFKLSLGKASDWMNGLKDKFSVSIKKVQGFLGSCFEATAEGSTFIGIRFDAVDGIRGSIRTYVTKIQTEIDKINSDLSPEKAFKGDELVPACRSFVKAVTEVADAYVSSLLAYSDKMYEYAEAMGKNQTNLSSNINEEAQALSSSAEKYVEKY